MSISITSQPNRAAELSAPAQLPPSLRLPAKDSDAIYVSNDDEDHIQIPDPSENLISPTEIIEISDSEDEDNEEPVCNQI